MGQLTFTFTYAKNRGTVYSSTELINLFFFGTPPKDKNGNQIPDDTIDFYIQSAQKELADYLSIKLQPTYISENRDYLYDDWIKWGYIPTTYPVVTPLALGGYVNTALQIIYPPEWLKAKTQSPDKDLFHRSISLVPFGGASAATVTGGALYSISPYMGYWGSQHMPNYWLLEYITGDSKINPDILRAIGMMAALNLFIILQDSLFGAGVSNKSVGIDGLSQSVGINAKGAYANRIAELKNSLDDGKGNGLLHRLKMRYLGIQFNVC